MRKNILFHPGNCTGTWNGRYCKVSRNPTQKHFVHIQSNDQIKVVADMGAYS